MCGISVSLRLTHAFHADNVRCAFRNVVAVVVIGLLGQGLLAVAFVDAIPELLLGSLLGLGCRLVKLIGRGVAVGGGVLCGGRLWLEEAWIVASHIDGQPSETNPKSTSDQPSRDFLGACWFFQVLRGVVPIRFHCCLHSFEFSDAVAATSRSPGLSNQR
ncbi:hypothetical protein D3C81_1764940 [compost metagenome]